MKNLYLLITIIIALLLSACGSQTTATPIPTLVLDGSNTSSNGNQISNANAVSASAQIVPLTESHLSFAAIGRVTEVNVEVGDKASAGDVLARLDTSILEAKIREAQANLDAAQAQYKYLKRIGTNEIHLETAATDVERAQALLDLANANLAAQSELIAPIDGTVIEVNTGPSETVTPGQVVIVLADLTRFQVETTDLSERDVTKIQNGQSATIFIEALGDEFTGKVVDVDRIGSTLGGDVVYTVTIAFTQQPKGLLWGMSADVDIEIGK